MLLLPFRTLYEPRGILGTSAIEKFQTRQPRSTKAFILFNLRETIKVRGIFFNYKTLRFFAHARMKQEQPSRGLRPRSILQPVSVIESGKCNSTTRWYRRLE